MQLANAFADLLLNANVSGRESETKTNIKTKKRKYLHNRGIQEVNQNNNNGAHCMCPVPTVYVGPTQRLL